MVNSGITVLIVEDDDYKFERVQKALEDANVGGLSVVRKTTGQGAFAWLCSNSCDVMVLDFCLPQRDGDEPSLEVGPLLLENILRSDANCSIPSRTVGLTAYGENVAAFQEQFKREGVIVADYRNDSKDWEATVSRTLQRQSSDSAHRTRGLIIPLHGIRTVASWHRTLADVAFQENWSCPVDGWWYGKWSVFAFLSPFARHVKVQWFRERYTKSKRENSALLGPSNLPSVVAHSFGTFMVGNALLKFKDIKVDKVVLCGSILPVDFPWDELIENGQVGTVLNCVGTEDIWPKVSSFVVPGTGKSGSEGFRTTHELLKQQYYNLAHSEFFDSEQMRGEWFSFLNTPSNVPAKNTSTTRIRRPVGDHPWLARVLGPFTWLTLVTICCWLIYYLALGYVGIFDSACAVVGEVVEYLRGVSVDVLGHVTTDEPTANST